MKRFGALTVAALFVVGFLVGGTALAAPTLSGEFKIESKTTIGKDSDIDFGGSPTLSLTLNAAEEGLWKLSAQFSSIVSDPNAGDDTHTIRSDDEEEEDIVIDLQDDALKLGKYYLELTPGPFSFYAWGNKYETSDVADAFEFIKSGKGNDAADPKFRLTTGVVGANVTVDYATADADALYAFAKAGMFGVAFRDTNVGDSETGMGASADVTADLGVAKLTAGAAFDFQAAEGKGSVAFGVKGESEVAPGLKVNAGYKSDGRGQPEDTPSTEISAGAEYSLAPITVGADLSLASEYDEDEAAKVATTTVGGKVSYGEIASAGVEYKKTDKTDDKTPTLKLTASAEYPVIADVFTVSADFEMVNDKDPFGAAADDYVWVDVDETPIGENLVTVLKVSASAPYKLTPVFTVTPGFEYAAYTFDPDGEAKATILKLDTEYKVSEAASLTFGIANVNGEVKDTTLVDPVEQTRLKAVVSVKF